MKKDHLDKVVAYAESLNLSGEEYPQDFLDNLARAIEAAKTVQGEGSNQMDVEVAWDVNEEQFAKPWTIVTVTGTLSEKEEKVRTKVMVVPGGLTHFIDSGTVNVSEEGGNPGHSQVYELIASRIALDNEQADKTCENGSWGYVDDSTSGLFVEAGKDIVYKIPLKAGKHKQSQRRRGTGEGCVNRRR